MDRPVFSWTDFNRFDEPAREALRRSPILLTFLMEHFGIYCFRDNPDGQYGVDMMGLDEDQQDVRLVELEGRGLRLIEKGKCIFGTIHLPARKAKLFEANVLFVTFNIDYDFAIVVDPEVATPSVATLADTRRGDGAERFLDIPVRQVYIVKTREDVPGPDLQVPKALEPVEETVDFDTVFEDLYDLSA